MSRQTKKLTIRAGYVKFTAEMIEKFSPQRHLDKLVAPIIVAHGTLETPEFQRQNREFAAAVKAAGKPVKFLVGPRLYAFRDARRWEIPTGYWAAQCWSK